MPISRGKWQIIVSALGVFILGFLAGAFSLNLYRNRMHQSSEPPRVHWRQIIDSLNLNPDQKTQVDSIFNETRTKLQDVRKDSHTKVDEIRKTARDRLQAILTPEQWKKIEDQEKAVESQEKQGEQRQGDNRR